MKKVFFVLAVGALCTLGSCTSDCVDCSGVSAYFSPTPSPDEVGCEFESAVLVEFELCEDDYGGWIEEDDDTLSALLPLREDILRGDYILAPTMRGEPRREGRWRAIVRWGIS